MKTVLDDDLRERWADPAEGSVELQRARVELQQRVAADDGDSVARSHVGRALQRLSEACRFSGELEESLRHKDAAIVIWNEQHKHRACFLVRLQRALVLAELGDPEAEAQMSSLREELVGDETLEPYYHDFWLEYDARRLFWAGDSDLACDRLRCALAFREEHRAKRIVEWTRMALAKVESGDVSV